MADIRQKQQVIETSEAQIAVHWREEEYYYPSSKFIGQANLTDPDILNRFSEDKYPECFREYADMLNWDQYWYTTLDTSDPPFWKWFVGGKLNASYNCVDRHLAKYKNKAALIFVPEPESETPISITYRELFHRVNEFAALLSDFCGLKAGDRVTLHMPMVPELPITMLACARLGVVHSQVFGGFSGNACGTRIADSGSRVLTTLDGYLSYVAGTSKYYQDIHPDDTYWCMADIGWITGHSYIVYGPLALGTTSVIYEGTPNYPDAGRPWRIAERLGVNIFHTSPTAIRMLRKVGPDEPAKYDFHFKAMTTVGEPIEPEVYRWYYKFVGKGEAIITDTWWQTETGGFLGTGLPALFAMKPGSCGPAALGIYLAILDENGDPIPKGSGKAGDIVARNPWPGIFQTIWGQPETSGSSYFDKYTKDRAS